MEEEIRPNDNADARTRLDIAEVQMKKNADVFADLQRLADRGMIPAASEDIVQDLAEELAESNDLVARKERDVRKLKEQLSLQIGREERVRNAYDALLSQFRKLKEKVREINRSTMGQDLRDVDRQKEWLHRELIEERNRARLLEEEVNELGIGQGESDVAARTESKIAESDSVTDITQRLTEMQKNNTKLSSRIKLLSDTMARVN